MKNPNGKTDAQILSLDYIELIGLLFRVSPLLHGVFIAGPHDKTADRILQLVLNSSLLEECQCSMEFLFPFLLLRKRFFDLCSQIRMENNGQLGLDLFDLKNEKFYFMGHEFNYLDEVLTDGKDILLLLQEVSKDNLPSAVLLRTIDIRAVEEELDLFLQCLAAYKKFLSLKKLNSQLAIVNYAFSLDGHSFQTLAEVERAINNLAFL